MNGKVFQVKEGHCLLVGGLAVMENREGLDIDICVYGSQNINYKVISISSANMYYYKQYNQLVYPVYHDDLTQVTFHPHLITLNFDSNGYSDYELEISNIAVCTFSYPGK